MAAVKRAPPRPTTGPYAAACLAAAIGLLALALVQVGTVLSDSFKETVFDLGKAVIPNAEGVGPYSGKETVMIIAWLGSWLVLHAGLRERDIEVRTWFGFTLVLIFAAALLMWPPVWHILAGE